LSSGCGFVVRGGWEGGGGGGGETWKKYGSRLFENRVLGSVCDLR
jgi:hypothetical protein